MTFDNVNIGLRFVLFVIAVYKITQFRDMANTAERLGIGMMGSGSLLTIPIIMNRDDNPFNGWAVTILTLGAVLLLAGRTYRDRKHAKRNAQQVEHARLYLEARGRL